MRVRGLNVRLGVMILAVAATLLLPGCADYVIKMGHLKDNPMDQAVGTGNEFTHLQETRDRLLKRFPLGQPVREVKRYLESVGATCRQQKLNSAIVDCGYRQREDAVLRTPIGDFLRIRSLYDFRISLASSKQRLSRIEVCRRITRNYYEELSGKPVRRLIFPFECTTDSKPK